MARSSTGPLRASFLRNKLDALLIYNVSRRSNDPTNGSISFYNLTPYNDTYEPPPGASVRFSNLLSRNELSEALIDEAELWRRISPKPARNGDRTI